MAMLGELDRRGLTDPVAWREREATAQLWTIWPGSGRCPRCGLRCYRSNLSGRLVSDIAESSLCPAWNETDRPAYPYAGSSHTFDESGSTWGPGIGWVPLSAILSALVAVGYVR